MHNQLMNSRVAIVLLVIVLASIILLHIISGMVRTSDDVSAIIDTTARTGVTRNADWTDLVGVGGYGREFDGILMVLVPTGCFRMGNDEDAYHWNGTSYRQGVPDGGEQCIEEPFWIDQTEITQADFSRLGGQQAEPSQFEGDIHPVEHIIWQEAHDFCISRGARLPTEAEWEYAARGPNNLFFPWGNEWIPEYAIWNRTSSQGTADVGTVITGASWVGALDMSGNVWEWTSSIYEAYPYTGNVSSHERDAIVPSFTIRGGSWDGVNIGNLHSATRDEGFSGLRFNDFGFRCVRSYDRETLTNSQ